MKAVLQRVARARVTVDGKVVAQIGNPLPGEDAASVEKSDETWGQKCGESGLLILFGVEIGDSEEDANFLAAKCSELRIFSDEDGKMNRSLIDIQGRVIVVSQFTLLADCRKGRRPAFVKAAPPEEGKRLYEYFVEQLRSRSIEVGTGIFGAHMDVELVNDGPVTILLEHQGGNSK